MFNPVVYTYQLLFHKLKGIGCYVSFAFRVPWLSILPSFSGPIIDFRHWTLRVGICSSQSVCPIE